MSALVDNQSIPLREWDGKAIILVDLDAFFASVEQLDHPEWRGKPVIVGGDPDKHGVVSTCSYEARKFGVRSAMPSSTANKLCPHAIWTGGNFARYREVSDEVMQIIRDETPYVQQVSIDEAFADITPTRINSEHPFDIASRIQERVSALGVTCSIGVGISKSVAKIASERDKPNGLTIVYPGSEDAFLKDLPIEDLSGVGPAAKRKLNENGIETLGDMGQASDVLMNAVFGKNAEMMRARAQGKDISSITPEREVKSISHEITFSESLVTRIEMEAALKTLLTKVMRRVRRKHLLASTLSIKVRFKDRSVRNAQIKLSSPSDDDLLLMTHLPKLLDKVISPGSHVILLGVGVSGFFESRSIQTPLFELEDDLNAGTSDEERPLVEDETKRKNLIAATDVLKDKFGEEAVVLGSEFRNRGNNTGSSSKNPADMR